MSATAAIDKEIDRELLGLLHEKVTGEIESIMATIEAYQSTANGLQAKLDRIEERMASLTAPVTEKSEIVGKGGRVKKGLSDKLITEFLQSANGVGANMQQITSSTGTTTSSARRTIKKLVAENKVEIMDRARWRWKTDLSATKGKEKGRAT